MLRQAFETSPIGTSFGKVHITNSDGNSIFTTLGNLNFGDNDKKKLEGCACACRALKTGKERKKYTAGNHIQLLHLLFSSFAS